MAHTTNDFLRYRPAASAAEVRKPALPRIDAGQALRVALMVLLAAGFMKLTQPARVHADQGVAATQETALSQNRRNH